MGHKSAKVFIQRSARTDITALTKVDADQTGKRMPDSVVRGVLIAASVDVLHRSKRAHFRRWEDFRKRKIFKSIPLQVLQCLPVKMRKNMLLFPEAGMTLNNV